MELVQRQLLLLRLVAIMVQAMACSPSVVSKFAWKLSSESPLFASSKSWINYSSSIGPFFSFVFGPIFAKLEQFNSNSFGLTCSHWLAVVLPLSPMGLGHPWMDDGTDRWMDGKLHEKRPRRPLLYVIDLLLFACRLTYLLKRTNIAWDWYLSKPLHLFIHKVVMSPWKYCVFIAHPPNFVYWSPPFTPMMKIHEITIMWVLHTMDQVMGT